MQITLKYFMAIALIAFSFQNATLAQGGSSARNLTNKMNIISFNKYLPNAKVDEGYFILNSDDDEVCIQMEDEKQRNRKHYMIENCFSTNEIELSGSSTSTVNRTSGTLKFELSSVDRGEFTFTKNEDFVGFLRNEGIKLDNDLYYFKLFLGDIDKSYVSDIKALGFQPTITELGRLVWHDASIEYIEEMHQSFPTISLSDISMMSAHEISIDFLQGFRALGIDNIDVHSAKQAKMKGVSHKMIRDQIRSGKVYSSLKEYMQEYHGKCK